MKNLFYFACVFILAFVGCSKESEPPIASFSSSPNSGDAPLSIQFTNASTGASSYEWNFGDGAESIEVNPKHEFKDAGSYTVILTATGDGGQDIATSNITINEELIAKFTSDNISGAAPLNVSFSNNSKGSDSYSWDFGDGGRSMDKDPNYTFQNPGTYTVTLTIERDGEEQTFSQTIVVKQGKAEWLILNYFAGNNNLEDYLVNDLQEMEKAGGSNDVVSLVMLNSRKAGGVAKYYKIEKHTEHTANQILSPVVNDDLGSANMASPGVLRDFIEWGIENYPAKRYMLVINSHGGGWTGICPQEDNGELMKMDEFGEALGNVYFDAIVFHSCLMGTVEVAYEIRDNAEYMVASPGNMPAVSVLAADVWLNNLIDSPFQETKTLVKDIAKSVYERSQESGLPTAISVTDLSKIQTLISDINDFRKNMLNLNHGCWNEVKKAWDASVVNGIDSYTPILRDLRLFVSNLSKSGNKILDIPLIKNSIEDVKKTLEEDVVIMKYNSNSYSGGGLTIHFPHDRDYLLESRYRQLNFQPATEWLDFIKSFIASTPDDEDEKAYFNGKVTYLGNELSNPWYLGIFLKDENDDFELETQLSYDTEDGSYGVETSNGSWPRQYYLTAWSDNNKNGEVDAGDGWGYWDKDGDGYIDALTIWPEDDLQNIDIVMTTEKSAHLKSGTTDNLMQKIEIRGTTKVSCEIARINK